MQTLNEVHRSKNADCCTPAVNKQAAAFKPAVDLFEDDRAYHIHADIPGSTMEDITVELENGALSVGARVQPRNRPGVRLLSAEYGVGDFHRVFRVGDDVDASAVSAEYGNGVLSITLPKGERSRPRRIPISTR